ncbi:MULTISPECIES: DsbE family thiol:disulfide interchange protein [Rhodomicrobium]|uniref:DsbE family thiol:disulfide interchange protein n=1 Tax=Rhodomicrobium TaxID=1068 RepID=UPI000B4A9AA5|nr:MULTISPECIES: DsbE family thiol:disulfide interchange protein [Rhodomicrobium]
MSIELPAQRRFRGGYLLPLAIFAIMAVLFYAALHSGDPSRLPSALIGKPVPQFSLPPIENVADTGKATPGFATADLANGEVSVVTVWASWCAPCVEENPNLIALKAQGMRLIGINYKDDPAAARRFLTRYGNPFDAIGADTTGRVAIDWGVYGVPETYVVDGRGQIVHKVVGPLGAEVIKSQLLPAVAKAKADAKG